MIFDAKLMRIDGHAQVAVVRVIIVFERNLVFAVAPRLHNLGSTQWSPCWMQFLDVMAPVPANDVRNFGPIRTMTGEPLVVVGMPSENGVRPHARLSTYLIHLLPHGGAGGVLRSDGIIRIRFDLFGGPPMEISVGFDDGGVI